MSASIPNFSETQSQASITGRSRVPKLVWPPQSPEAALRIASIPEATKNETRSQRMAQVDSHEPTYLVPIKKLIAAAFGTVDLMESKIWIEEPGLEKPKSHSAALADLFRDRAPSMRNQDFAQLVYNLPYTDLDIDHYSRRITRVANAIENQLARRRHFFNTDFSDIYFGISAFDSRVVGRRFMDQLGAHLQAKAQESADPKADHRITPPQVVKIFYGLKNLNSYDDDNKIVTDFNTWKPLLKIIREHPDMSFSNSRNFRGIFEGLQSYEVKDFGPDLLNEIVMHIPEDMQFRRDDLVDALWNFYLKKPDDFSKEALTRLEGMVVRSIEKADIEFRAIDYYKMLYGLQQFYDTDMYKFIAGKLRDELKTNEFEISDLNALNLTQAFLYGQYHHAQAKPDAKETLKHLRVPSVLQEAAKRFQKANSGNYASGPEYVAHSVLQNDFPASRESIVPNTFLHNFEVDLFDKDRNRVIEIDGHEHSGARIAKDQLKDKVVKYLHQKRRKQELTIDRIDARPFNDVWTPKLIELAETIYSGVS